MESNTSSAWLLAAHSKDLARRLLAIGGNRLELLKVELQEERKCLLQSSLLAISTAVLLLLAGMALTAAIVIWLWAYSPVAVLLTLTGIYGIVGVCVYRRLAGLLRGRQILSATFDQLEMDSLLFGKSPRRNPLESRKQLIVAESELNRALLAREITALNAGVGEIADRAKSVGVVASSAAMLATGVADLQRRKAANREATSSWLPLVVKSTDLISSIWLAIRSRDHGRRKKPAQPAT